MFSMATTGAGQNMQQRQRVPELESESSQASNAASLRDVSVPKFQDVPSSSPATLQRFDTVRGRFEMML